MILYGIDISNKKEVIKWLNKIRKGTGDARPLWKAMSKKIPEFTDYEFDPESDPHKMWQRLKPSYVKWKKKHASGATGMGYLWGNLQKAAGKKAKTMFAPQTMLWMVNPDVATKKGKVGDYLFRFNYGFMGTDSLGRSFSQPAREIFKYTGFRVNSFLKLDAKKFKSGVTHASFTYNWLRKVLEVPE